MPILFDEPFLRKLDRLALYSRRQMPGRSKGERRSLKRGQSVEFTDFRPYTTGDDFRKIDWNAYARLEKFFIKLFVDEEDLTVHFFLDNSRSMDWGETNKLHYTIRLVAAIAYIALSGLDRVAVYTLSGHSLPALRGKRSAITLFQFLQSFVDIDGTSEIDNKIQDNPDVILQSFSNTTHLSGPLLIVSDLMDDRWKKAVTHLAGRGFDISIIHLLSAEELDPDRFINPQMIGDFKLIDSETFQPLEITADYQTLVLYRKRIKEWLNHWKSFCSTRGINYIPVESSTPLEDLLFSELRKKQVLK